MSILHIFWNVIQKLFCNCILIQIWFIALFITCLNIIIRKISCSNITGTGVFQKKLGTDSKISDVNKISLQLE